MVFLVSQSMCPLLLSGANIKALYNKNFITHYPMLSPFVKLFLKWTLKSKLFLTFLHEGEISFLKIFLKRVIIFKKGTFFSDIICLHQVKVQVNIWILNFWIREKKWDVGMGVDHFFISENCDKIRKERKNKDTHMQNTHIQLVQLLAFKFSWHNFTRIVCQ